VLHLWSLDVIPANDPGQSGIKGFYSLLFLAQTWPKSQQDRYLFVISNQIHAVTGTEELRVMAAALLGPVQTMGSEYPDLHCRGIDIVRPGSGADTRQLVVDLLGECQTASIDCLVAYRGGKRWIRQFEPIRLPAVNPGGTALRHEGVYLITGGLGGIGLSLAAYLAEKAQAKLVLTGRSALPGHRAWDDWLGAHGEDDAAAIKIRRIRELQRLGAEVLVLHADVGNRQQMKAVIERTNARFGTIHGVIHAAGVPAGGVIELKTAAGAAEILSPKVQGSIILNELLEAQQLDFLVFCSSLDAVMATPGQVDYCGANAFMDAYAHALHTQNVNAVSINWDAWQEVGMAANIMLPGKMKSAYRQDLQAIGIIPAEGVEAFARILAHPMPQVLLSTIDWQQRSQMQKTAGDKTSAQLKKITGTSRHNRPALTTGYVEPRSLTEQKIAGIWQLLLGIEPIGIYDDFFELGGHSLLMTQLILRLHETFSVKLPMQTLFEFSTIAALAEEIDDIQTMRRQLQTANNRSAYEVEEIEL
jgi:NAD(P)-dependent dehydrogenase (short-subunit alcohol dehydrogenase family)/acyl carrier protein